MHLIKNYWLVIVGMGVGLVGGYIYWQQIGCISGTCPITSSSVNSSLYGAIMGGLVVNLFRKENETGKSNPK